MEAHDVMLIAVKYLSDIHEKPPDFIDSIRFLREHGGGDKDIAPYMIMLGFIYRSSKSTTMLH